MGGALIVVAHLQMILWPGILIDIKLHQEQNHIFDAHILQSFWGTNVGYAKKMVTNQYSYK